MNFIYFTAQIIKKPRLYQINKQKYLYVVLCIPSQQNHFYNIIAGYGKIDNRFILDKTFYKKDLVFIEGNMCIRKKFKQSNIVQSKKVLQQISFIKISKIQSC